MAKKPLIVLMLLALLMLTCNLSTPPRTRRGGEILWQEGSLTLYRCGPDKVDICFDNGIGVTKVYIGEN